MKRAILLVLTALVACTGTQESAVPILLVVGYEEETDGGPGAGKVGLIEDAFNGVGSTDRLSFLSNSDRDLPASPRAYDVTDRNLARDRLVVLSRADAAQGSASFLSFFNLEGIGPDDLGDFEPTRPDLELSAATLDTTEPDLPLDLSFCPVDVQISEGGRYATLLHDGEPCGLTGFAAVDVIDLRPATPKLLERFNVQIIPTRFFLRQERTNAQGNRLYFLQNDPAGVQVTELTLPDENDNNPDIDPILGGDDLTQVRDLPDDNQDAVDLGLVLDTTDDEVLPAPVLVTLFDESFLPIRNYANTGDDAENPPTAGTRVATIEQSTKLITDDFLQIGTVFVLGEDQFTLHENVTAPAEEAADIVAADAVYEPNNRFIFFASEQSIGIFDPTNYDFGGDNDIGDDEINITVYSDNLEQLTEPAFITWTEAIGSAPLDEAAWRGFKR